MSKVRSTERSRNQLSVEFCKEVWVKGTHLFKMTFCELREAMKGLNSYIQLIRKLRTSEPLFLNHPHLVQAMSPWSPPGLLLLTSEERVSALPNITQRAAVLLTSPLGPYPLSISSWLQLRSMSCKRLFSEFGTQREPNPVDPFTDKSSDADYSACLLAVA